MDAKVDGELRQELWGEVGPNDLEVKECRIRLQTFMDIEAWFGSHEAKVFRRGGAYMIYPNPPQTSPQYRRLSSF